MKLQIHNVKEIVVRPADHYTQENGKVKGRDFIVREIFITDKDGVTFVLELFSYENDLSVIL
jgi:hypothetical protein